MAKAIILKDLIKELGLKIYTFEAEIGTSGRTISMAIERNSDLSTTIIDKIIKKYPQVNRDWLYTGEGEMLIAPALEVKEGKKKEVIALGKHIPSRLKPDEYAAAFGDWEGLPVYNIPISASFVSTYRDEGVYQPQYYLHDPRFRDCEFGAVISGDSMHSEIRHGDIVICREIKDTRFIVFGEIYYIVSSNGQETCKYINAGKDENTLLLVPRNESISPSPLPKDMLLRLYKVRGIIRGY